MTQTTIRERLDSSRGMLFDLDNTLYPREKGVFDRVNERINQFVAGVAACGPDEVRTLRRDFIRRYGTTLGGLMRHHGVDPDEYLAYVHQVPVEEMLGPDPALRTFLESIRLPKVIFTNASAGHAERVLRALDADSLFDGVCDLASTGYLGKPHLEAFRAAAALLSCPLERLIFLDDVPENIEAGARFGALTVHVGDGSDGPGHLKVRQVVDLGRSLGGVPWYGSKKGSPGV
ncbi:MAG: pyrimidine 5'-nucleotidase [bacterium]|nr:MAG: pyrimidine 5'-nucleotidase [bacterium]